MTDDRRHQLRALADGGTEGLSLYRQSQERVRKDQQSAVDEALSAASGRNASGETLDYLGGIIRPVGDAQVARLAGAGDRYRTSQSGLSDALSAYTQQAGSAEQMAFDQSYQDALEAAQARSAGAGGGGGSSYTDTQLEDIARFYGGEYQGQALAAQQEANKQAKVEDLLSLASRAFGDLDPMLQKGLLDQVWANTDNPDAIAAMIDEYSPAYSEEADNIIGSGITNVSDALVDFLGGTPSAPELEDPGRARAVNNMIDRYASETLPQTEQDIRELEANRYLFNRQAFADLTGDPMLAAGLFPREFDPAEDQMGADQSIDDYINTGMFGSELEDAREQSDDEFLRTTAAGAGVSDKIVNDMLDQIPVDATDVYTMLADPDVAGIVSGAVQSGVSESRKDPGEMDDFGSVSGGGDVDPVEVASWVAANQVRTQLAGADPEYVEALALIAAEQASVYARGS